MFLLVRTYTVGVDAGDLLGSVLLLDRVDWRMVFRVDVALVYNTKLVSVLLLKSSRRVLLKFLVGRDS